MDTFFLVLLVFLAILAAVDLFVGVRNDAVNFLNSAVGSRIAPFKVVLGVAAVGVLLGATFSGGMMEIARSGVFHPSMFSFSDVIAIYFAVMVTDVLLLNVFNKMPSHLDHGLDRVRASRRGGRCGDQPSDPER